MCQYHYAVATSRHYRAFGCGRPPVPCKFLERSSMPALSSFYFPLKCRNILLYLYGILVPCGSLRPMSIFLLLLTLLQRQQEWGGGFPSILVSCLLPPPTPPEVIAVEWLLGRKWKASWLPVFKTLYLLHESLGPPAILAIHSFISLFFLPSVLQPAFHRSVSPDDLSIAALTRAPTYLSPSNSHLACYCMAISRFIYSFS